MHHCLCTYLSYVECIVHAYNTSIVSQMLSVCHVVELQCVCTTDFTQTPHTVLSELQVLDMLMAAGIGQHNPVLTSLFRARKVHESLMPYFYCGLDLDTKTPASHVLLLDVARRGKIMARGLHAHEALKLTQLSCTGTVHYSHAIGTFTLWTYHSGESRRTHSCGLLFGCLQPRHMCSCRQCVSIHLTSAFLKQSCPVALPIYVCLCTASF